MSSDDDDVVIPGVTHHTMTQKHIGFWRQLSSGPSPAERTAALVEATIRRAADEDVRWRASVARQLVEAGYPLDPHAPDGDIRRFRGQAGGLVHKERREIAVYIGGWCRRHIMATTDEPAGTWCLSASGVPLIWGGTVYRTLGDAVRALDLLKEG